MLAHGFKTFKSQASGTQRVVKTPGGKLVYHNLKKIASSPNAVTVVSGIPPCQYTTIFKRQKTVRRAYGGSRCGKCVKIYILRNFLVVEAKLVKKVIKSQQKK
ncbi:60s ribosomal protein l34-b [Mycena epipterygia]|nr:60s ribosomal protein l34-b [Mycena epipterygia]